MQLKPEIRFYSWIASWLDIICGIFSVLTFAYYRPWWDFNFRIWSMKRGLKINREKINAKL